jgi:hypothetical protein
MKSIQQVIDAARAIANDTRSTANERELASAVLTLAQRLANAEQREVALRLEVRNGAPS